MGHEWSLTGTGRGVGSCLEAGTLEVDNLLEVDSLLAVDLEVAHSLLRDAVVPRDIVDLDSMTS